MAKIKVKLRDTNSVFYDGEQKVFISGNEIVEVERNDKVDLAIRYGALLIATSTQENENAIEQAIIEEEHLKASSNSNLELAQEGSSERALLSKKEVIAKLIEAKIPFDPKSTVEALNQLLNEQH